MEIVKGEYKLYIMPQKLKITVQKTEIIDGKEITTIYTGKYDQRYKYVVAYSQPDKIVIKSEECHTIIVFSYCSMDWPSGKYEVECYRDPPFKQHTELDKIIDEMKNAISNIGDKIKGLEDQMKELHLSQEAASNGSLRTIENYFETQKGALDGIHQSVLRSQR